MHLSFYKVQIETIKQIYSLISILPCLTLVSRMWLCYKTLILHSVHFDIYAMALVIILNPAVNVTQNGF